ncbi:capsid [uncultured virus]|uniref:Capsid n=1 Tax=uncultured virus TaxID=340016 RepID=A0A2K9LSN0_9VIRU|nr:capsid [uncultured virus]
MPFRRNVKRYRKANRKRSFTRAKTFKRLSRRIKAARPALKFVNSLLERDKDANNRPLSTYSYVPNVNDVSIQNTLNNYVSWGTYILNSVPPTNAQNAAGSSLVPDPINNVGQRTGWRIRSKFVNIRLKLTSVSVASRWRIMLISQKQNVPIDPMFPMPYGPATTVNALFQNSVNNYSPLNDGFLTSPLQDRYKDKFSVYYDKVITPDNTKGLVNYIKIKKRLNQICHFDNVESPATGPISSLYTFDVATKGCLFLVIMKSSEPSTPGSSLGSFDLDHRYYFTDN